MEIDIETAPLGLGSGFCEYNGESSGKETEQWKVAWDQIRGFYISACHIMLTLISQHPRPQKHVCLFCVSYFPVKKS